MRSTAIVPAAGDSVRFGSDKLLADIGPDDPRHGDPILDCTISSLLNGGLDHVFVVIRPDLAEAIAAVPVIARATGQGVQVLINGMHMNGMFSSIQVGVAASDADVYAVLPGDMPFVSESTVRSLLGLFETHGGIVSPRYKGKRGHPVLLPGRLRDEILRAHPTSTLHDVIKSHASDRIDLEVEDPGVVRDVDRPEDLHRA